MAIKSVAPKPHEPDEGGNQWTSEVLVDHLMREAISGHQRPSEAIRGHQRPSEAIRGHQRPSEAIKGHQRPSKAIRGRQTPSKPHEPSQAKVTSLQHGHEAHCNTLPKDVGDVMCPVKVRPGAHAHK